MNREERLALAKQLHSEGYNCAQAALLSFGDLTHLEERSAKQVAMPFGGGVGGMHHICGAISGIAMAAGFIYGKINDDAQNKQEMYAITQELAKQFERNNGSMICATLKNLDKSNKVPMKTCDELIQDAVNILCDYLEEHPAK